MLVLHVSDANRKARCTQLTHGPRGIWITSFDAAVWILAQVYARREGMCVISHTAWSSGNVMRVRAGRQSQEYARVGGYGIRLRRVSNKSQLTLCRSVSSSDLIIYSFGPFVENRGLKQQQR